MSEGKVELTLEQLQAIIDKGVSAALAKAAEQSKPPEQDEPTQQGFMPPPAGYVASAESLPTLEKVAAAGTEEAATWMPQVGGSQPAKAPATPVTTVWMPQMVTDGSPGAAGETAAAESAPSAKSLVVGNPTENGLPPVKEMKVHSTAKLPAGARKRWNVKAITGAGQTTFEIRQGDGETEFTMTGASKALATEVIIALSLIDRTRRNAMRLALEEGYAKTHPTDPTLQSYDKLERAKLKEFLSWLRKYGAAGLDAGHRPWDGKVAGTVTAPPNINDLLASLGVSATEDDEN